MTKYNFRNGVVTVYLTNTGYTYEYTLASTMNMTFASNVKTPTPNPHSGSVSRLLVGNTSLVEGTPVSRFLPV